MAYPDGALSRWFNNGRSNDEAFLTEWRDAPLTYVPGQENGPAWNADHYEIVLGTDSSGALFKRAADLTLQNRFYPVEVMEAVSDYSRVGRWVRVGDRVVQRIHIFQVAGRPVLDVLTMNEITEVIYEDRRAGFTYTTTAAHSEIGEWSPVITWRDNGEVVLTIDVISRTRPGVSPRMQRFARKMQLRAHKLSIANFQALLNGAPAEQQPFPAEVLPVALLGAALVLGLFFGLKYRQGSGPRQR